jgi:hypothetical protein
MMMAAAVAMVSLFFREEEETIDGGRNGVCLLSTSGRA